MFSGWDDKLNELQEHPELANTRGYRLEKLQRQGEPYAWFQLLMKQPQLAPPPEWWSADLRRRGDLPWGRLLAAQPQFEEYCNWGTVSRLDLVELAILAPEIFARKFPHGRWRDLCAFLTDGELVVLFSNVPGADKYFDMNVVGLKFTPDQWLCILAYQPQLEKYFDWSSVENRPSAHWGYLLRRQPQFAEHCAWSHLGGWQIRQILVKQPQFADRCDFKKLTGTNWSGLLREQPRFADKCDFSLLDDDDWDDLLKKQPQFAERRNKFKEEELMWQDYQDYREEKSREEDLTEIDREDIF